MRQNGRRRRKKEKVTPDYTWILSSIYVAKTDYKKAGEELFSNIFESRYRWDEEEEEEGKKCCITSTRILSSVL